MKKWHAIALLLVGIFVFVVWSCWRALSVIPRYGDDHIHAEQESHDHFHIHSDGGTHGHRHAGLVFDTGHAHPHHHEHHHSESVASVRDSLTQIGHAHGAGTTRFYWAEARVDGDQIVVSFWTNRENQVVELTKVDTSFDAKLLDGTQSISRLSFRRQGELCVAQLSDDFLYLPTHVVSIENVELGSQKMAASIPLDPDDESPNRVQVNR